MHFGIDYGSKLAGTTVITYDVDGVLKQISSSKKENADAMVRNAVAELNPTSIYIDAPLSLPDAYFGKGHDFFYRKADRELRAMSPMFLGGLTARAMQLKSHIESLGIEVYETYPGALVRSMPSIANIYSKKDKSKIPELVKLIEEIITDKTIQERPVNIHQLDSILAWYSGHKHQLGTAHCIGDVQEGVIIF